MTTYLRIFAPWIAYAAVSSLAGWRAAMLAGAGVAILTSLGPIRRRTADLLSLGTIGFFLVMAGVAVVAPNSVLQHYTVVMSLATMGVLAAGSLALRQPFTLTIARRMTSPAVWDHPIFYRTNAVITAVWAASFFATATACAVLVVTVPPATGVWIGVCQVIGFLIPTVFTRRYPARLRARARTLGLLPA